MSVEQADAAVAASSVAEASERLGEVSAQVADLGRQIAGLSAERVGLVGRLHEAGWSHARIARAAGVTRGRVVQIVKGLIRKGYAPGGARTWSAAVAEASERLGEISAQVADLGRQIVRLSAERVGLVGRLSEAGWSHARIAEVAGVTRGRVFQILQGYAPGGAGVSSVAEQEGL